MIVNFYSAIINHENQPWIVAYYAYYEPQTIGSYPWSLVLIILSH